MIFIHIAPCKKLTQQTIMLQCLYKCEKSFLELKTTLTTALILTLPDGSDGYVVYCDAIRVSLGCVLIRQGEVIDYDSIQLKFYEKKTT